MRLTHLIVAAALAGPAGTAAAQTAPMQPAPPPATTTPAQPMTTTPLPPATTPAEPTTSTPTTTPAQPMTGATPPTTTAPPAAPSGPPTNAAVSVATAADLKAGTPVLDQWGGNVGTIESADAQGAVIATGKVRAHLSTASIGKNPRGLVIAMTKAQLEAAAGAHSGK